MYTIVNLSDGSVKIEENLDPAFLEDFDDYVITYSEVDDEGNLSFYEVQEDGSLDPIDPE